MEIQIAMKTCKQDSNGIETNTVENKTFVSGFISGRVLRKTFEMNKLMKKAQGDFDETTLDALIDYIVGVFGGQFTRDDFYDGIESKKIIPIITDCINEVINGMNKELNPNPNV